MTEFTPLHSPVVDEVWQEQTLLRLLNLVELPLLEGVLQCSHTPISSPPSHPWTPSNPDLIYSSNHLDRQILKAFRDSQYVWLTQFFKCFLIIELLPQVVMNADLISVCLQ